MTICDGCAENREAIQKGEANLEPCDLTVEVPGGQTLPQQFDGWILVSARLRR